MQMRKSEDLLTVTAFRCVITARASFAAEKRLWQSNRLQQPFSRPDPPDADIVYALVIPPHRYSDKESLMFSPRQGLPISVKGTSD